jgi:hypothetical protein
MNCRPGDLARIIKSTEGNLDKLVHVKRDSGHRDSGDVWWVAIALADMNCSDGFLKRGGQFHVADSALRPIRDPGEDATDQTLEWLPVPTKELA